MLKNKVAIVTGSTSGIGFGIAQELARSGCHIVLNGFGPLQDIQSLQKKLSNDFKVQVQYSSADMSDPEQIIGMVEFAEKQFGHVDILINNAGIQFTSSVETFPKEKWQSILSINLSAAFYASQAILPGLQTRGWGRIINIASAHGLVGSPHKAAYVAAKHGLVGLTKVIALENAHQNITCNAICPGWVLTPLVQKQIEDRCMIEGITFEQASRNLLDEKQPSRRFVQSAELGELALFLCSEAGGSMTGTTLSMDGGWTAQ